MRMLCERPGCSEPAAVAYGMRAEDLVFWLDVIVDGQRPERGVLCRRHADSMVVPRGWTLNDLRDPHLHLFRPPNRPNVAPSPRTTRRHQDPHVAAVAEQLALGVDPTNVSATDSVDGIESAEQAGGTAHPGALENALDEAGAEASNWSPTFDDADDLDGLLSARSPLLARAFRVNDRPS
jgi:hypothetical protein